MIVRHGNTIYCTSANAPDGTRVSLYSNWRTFYNTNDFETACQRALEDYARLAGTFDRAATEPRK